MLRGYHKNVIENFYNKFDKRKKKKGDKNEKGA